MKKYIILSIAIILAIAIILEIITSYIVLAKTLKENAPWKIIAAALGFLIVLTVSIYFLIQFKLKNQEARSKK